MGGRQLRILPFALRENRQQTLLSITALMHIEITSPRAWIHEGRRELGDTTKSEFVIESLQPLLVCEERPGFSPFLG